MLRWIAVGLISWSLAGAAQAQQEPQPAPMAETVEQGGKPTEPVPTVDEVMERLRALLGTFSPMGPAGQATVTDAAEIRRGDLIIASPVQPRRVGRLREDLIDRGLFGGGRTLLRAGTPVYQTRFVYSITSYGVVVSRTEYDAWCGTAVEEGRRRQRTRGYCALQAGSLHQFGEVIGGSPYWGRTLSGPAPASAVTIDEDAAVLAEFPRLELTDTFVEFDEDDADIRRGIRIDGGEIIELENISLARGQGGASLLRAAGGEIRILRTDNRRVARIEVVKPPEAYDVAEEEAQLRLIAERFVAQAQARADAAAAAAAQTQPTPPTTP